MDDKTLLTSLDNINLTYQAEHKTLLTICTTKHCLPAWTTKHYLPAWTTKHYLPAWTTKASENCSNQEEDPTIIEALAFFIILSTEF